MFIHFKMTLKSAQTTKLHISQATIRYQPNPNNNSNEPVMDR